MSAPAQKPRHPVLELLGRYRAIFAAAWAARHDLAGPRRLADEAAFLPAALSLQETPPHPAPRRLALALCALFVIALAWSVIGQVDIVAVAPGRIVVSERTKILQPLETSVVTRVRVRDGDVVQAGQVLVELDATEARADHASVREQLAAAISEEQRTAALIGALRHGHAPKLAPSKREVASASTGISPLPPGEGWGDGQAPPDATILTQLQAEWEDITAQLARFASEQARRDAEIATVRTLIAKVEATLPLTRQREADFQRLAAQGFVASHAVQDHTRERIEQERELATQRARLAEAQAALAETLNGRRAYLAETRRLLVERHDKAVLEHRRLAQERNKTEQRKRLTRLTAPVSGTVQQVAVHTEGGVVTPAQVLMVIVPSDAEVAAEVVIDNKDIGFVRGGQHAEVKLETFPYTRYGTVPASVHSVTADAVADEKLGAIFPARLTLLQREIAVDGKRIRLSPGMNVTAEIKTGKRRVIDYLLSPVRRTVSESLGER